MWKPQIFKLLIAFQVSRVQIYDTKYPSNLLHPYNLIYFNQLISPIYPHMYLLFYIYFLLLRNII
jgi:hypothetical protein